LSRRESSTNYEHSGSIKGAAGGNKRAHGQKKEKAGNVVWGGRDNQREEKIPVETPRFF